MLSAKPRSFLTMIFGYLFVIQLALPAILYMRMQNPTSAAGAFRMSVPARWTDLFPDPHFGRPIYLVAVVAFVAATMLPRMLIRKARAKRNVTADQLTPVELLLVPYLLRISLLETVSVLGLVLGILTENPYSAIPLFATGLLATLRMAPTEGFLQRFGYVAD